MADLIELIFAEDNETLVRKHNGQKVDAMPIGEPTNLFLGSSISSQKPKNANSYVASRIVGHVRHDGDEWMPAQFYKIYDPAQFKKLYDGIIARVTEHPEVELKGQFVDHSPFADVNVNLYVVPYNMIRDASKLNEILHDLTPEGIEPTKRMDAYVQEQFHVLCFGVLGFEVEIGEKRDLKTYTGMEPEELFKVIDEGHAIKRGVYKGGIKLEVFPHKKFVFQNANGIWVPEKYSCGFYELDALEKTDK